MRLEPRTAGIQIWIADHLILSIFAVCCVNDAFECKVTQWLWIQQKVVAACFKLLTLCLAERAEENLADIKVSGFQADS